MISRGVVVSSVRLRPRRAADVAAATSTVSLPQDVLRGPRAAKGSRTRQRANQSQGARRQGEGRKGKAGESNNDDDYGQAGGPPPTPLTPWLLPSFLDRG